MRQIIQPFCKSGIEYKICEYCKKEFYRNLGENRYNFLTRKVCSWTCRNNIIRLKSFATQFKNSIVIPNFRICKNCNQPFKQRNNERVYDFIIRKNCSNQCYHENHKKMAKKRIIDYPNTNPSLIGKKNIFKKGNNSIWKGRKHSELSKSRMSAARKNVVVPNKDTKPERMIQIWLALNQIKFIKHKPIKFGDRWVQVDIFIEPNLVIEVDGDYWHANPAKYKSDHIIAGGRYAKDIWAEDIRENHELNKLGYNVIRIWESDIKSNMDAATNPLLNLLKNKLELNKYS